MTDLALKKVAAAAWAGFFLMIPNFLCAEENLRQTGEISSIETSQRAPDWSLLIGGGGSVAIPNNDFIDSIAGGAVKARLTFRNFVSLESSLDFNQNPAQDTDAGGFDVAPFSSEADGNLFAVPFLHMILFHTPIVNNLSVYGGGGVGYQFNDAKDFEVDVELAGAPVGTLDVEVDDGFIGAAGGGFDFYLSDHFVFNFDVRYQFAEFELEQTGVISGSSVRIVEKEEHFDSVHLRASLLYRF